MKKLWKWLLGTQKQQCNIHTVIEPINCELSDNMKAQNYEYRKNRIR